MARYARGTSHSPDHWARTRFPSGERDVSPGETLDEMDVPGAVVHAVMEAAIATEMRSFVVTGTSRTLFLEWLT